MEGKGHGTYRPGTPAPLFMNSFEGFAGQAADAPDTAESQLDMDHFGDLQASGPSLQPWEFSMDLEQLDNQYPFKWDASPNSFALPAEPPPSMYGNDNAALQSNVNNILPDWSFDPNNSVTTDQDFLRWIDGAHRPTAPCSYCRYHRLQCLIIKTTQVNPNPVTACSSCVALFRECSLAIGEKRKASEFETNQPIIGHLHGVNEEYEDGLEFLNHPNWQNKADNLAANVSMEPSTKLGDSVTRVTPIKSKRAISKQDIRVLKAWLSEHRHSPYPSEEEKLELRATTGLTLLQISNWFANARRRQRQIQSIPIPAPGRGINSKTGTQEASDLSPISRWENSPPEDDPVDPSAVAKALASASKSGQTWSGDSQSDGIPAYRSFDNRSISSRETSLSGSDSSNSVWSHSSWASHHSFTSLSRPKRRRQQKRNNSGYSGSTFASTFHCTFCPDSFKKRHDWQRHEKSIHLPLEQWICCTGDGKILIPNTDAKQCIFCGDPNPTVAHLNSHEFNTCSERPISERTFKRKDHLRQHLVKFHGLAKPCGSVFALWKMEWGDLKSRCGFCDELLDSWEARVEHLATHFKEGATMDEWTGDWGFDGDVLALLQNAELPRTEAPGQHVGS